MIEKKFGNYIHWYFFKTFIVCFACAVFALDVTRAGDQRQEESNPSLKSTAPSAPGKPDQVLPKSDFKSLELPSVRTAKDRAKILSDLYERLQAADSKETAAVLVQAIEKVWITSGSDTIDLLMQRASTALEADDVPLAISLLDSIIELEPAYSEGWNKRAMVYFMRKDYDNALNDIRHVLALDPRHFQAINGLALILRELGDNQSALSAFRKVLKVHPFLDSAIQAETELSREVEGQGI